MSHEIQLQGARLIQEAWDKSVHLEEIIDSIEVGLREESDRSIDGAKCLVEAVAKTILAERGVELDGRESPAALMRKVFKSLDINNDGGDQLRDMLSGLTTAINGLERMRDAFGPLSHGKDAQHEKLGAWHRLMAARTAETIAVVLYEAHNATPVDLRSTRLPFKDADPENQTMDEESVVYHDEETHEVVINDVVRFRPSLILYTLDREAYVEERIRAVNDARLKAEAKNEQVE